MKKRKGKSDGERLDDIERQQAERQQLIEKDHLDDGDVEIQATKKPEFKVGDRVGSPLAGISPRQLRFMSFDKDENGGGNIAKSPRLPRAANKFDLFQNKGYCGSSLTEALPTGVGG
jgi:hypothetical protein